MLNFLIVIQIMREPPTGNVKKVKHNELYKYLIFLTDMDMLQEMYFD